MHSSNNSSKRPCANCMRNSLQSAHLESLHRCQPRVCFAAQRGRPLLQLRDLGRDINTIFLSDTADLQGGRGGGFETAVQDIALCLTP